MSDGNLVNIPVPSVDSVTVAVRVRPFSQREKNSGSKCVISMHSRTTTTIQDPKNPEHRKTFTFDLAYWSHNGFQKDKDGVFISADPTSKFASQKDIFHHLGKGILDSAWQGYNATLLAYGQTGSGKSYSMVGFGTNKGIIPNVCEELFQAMEKREKNQECQVTFSMLEIYNEQIRDLLPRTKKPGGLKVREDQQLGFYVDGLTSVPCENYTQIERLMEQGTKTRTTASTNMNASSSRSHMVITIQFKQVFLDRGLTKQSTINLVDLAGSERQKSSGSEGDRLREGSQVNLSLTNLGNVISALADAATGKKVLHVPYRDSVLTKLLQPALGGNSRTTLINVNELQRSRVYVAGAGVSICRRCGAVLSCEARKVPGMTGWAVNLRAPTMNPSTMTTSERDVLLQIAAISPADICYEETLSTLRYAERAKKIRNKAMVNTSMLTRESKAENIRVPLAHGNFRMAEQPARPLAEPGPWARELAQAREEWQQQYMAIAKEQRMMETLPHLLNVNEDPQLTGVLKYFIQADKHASFTNSDGKVTVTPHSKCKVVINGVPIMTKTKLQHLDRIILGSNSAYLYIGFPSERDSEDLNRFDYDFFQLERAAAEGVSMDKLGAASHSDGKADPSVLAVFQDYVRLMPLVAEANQMGEELKKGLRMELKVKNLAASDSRGHELQKEVMVKVTNQRTHEVWIWSKAKFINRKFLMEELYQRFLDGEDSHVAQEDDPFWDPVEVIHLGSAHVWLQSLAYSMKFEEQVEFLNCDGKEEAVVHVHMTPCSPEGWAAKSAGLEYLRSLLMRPKGWKQKAFSIRGIGSHQFSVPFLKLSKLVHELVGLELIPDCEEFRKERDTLRGSILYPTGSPVLVAYHMERLCRGFFLQRLACGEEDVVIDPSELLGRRMDFQVGLVRGLGIKWLKEDAERGIQMGYRIYDLSSTLYSKPVWKTVNPQIEETVQFTALNASQEFLNYLQTNALIIDLWGLPEGCAQMNCSHPDLTVTSEGHIMVDTKKMSTVVDTGQTPSNQISELYMKLLKFERETELLRSVNRALREENAFLKQSIEKVGSTPQAHKLSDALKVTWTAARPPAAREASPVRTGPASSDREFAKALKLLYHSMNVARGQLLRLRQAKPPEEDEMLRPFVHQQAQRLKDFGDLLESSLWRLKTDVAVIVKKKRASLLQAQ